MTGYYMFVVGLVFILLGVVFGTIALDYWDAYRRRKAYGYAGVFWYAGCTIFCALFSIWIFYCGIMRIIIPSISPEVMP